MRASTVVAVRSPRAGIAVMWALVVLSVLAVTSATAAWQFNATRRALENRQNKLQALWLARSGAELAIARLLANPEGYAGESVSLLADSQVRITVEKDAKNADVYLIRCEARYPVDGPGSATHSLTRLVTRRKNGNAVAIEMTSEPRTK